MIPVTGPLSELQIAYVCRETLQVCRDQIFWGFRLPLLSSGWFLAGFGISAQHGQDAP